MFARRCVYDRNRPQPFATVCNRPREGRMAVPAMVSSAKVVTFEGFRRRVASFHGAGVALRDIQTCFVTCGSRFVWQAQYFCDVFRRCVACFVAGAIRLEVTRFRVAGLTDGCLAWMAMQLGGHNNCCCKWEARRALEKPADCEPLALAWLPPCPSVQSCIIFRPCAVLWRVE